MREYLSDKQVKSELTALLQVVHEFLVEHNIQYTITTGTLLGAVRQHYEKDYNHNALPCAGSSLCRMRKGRRYIKSGN